MKIPSNMNRFTRFPITALISICCSLPVMVNAAEPSKANDQKHVHRSSTNRFGKLVTKGKSKKSSKLAIHGDLPRQDFTWGYGGRETDDGDFGPGSAWCNENGDWGATFRISNHSIYCHKYKVTVHYGYNDSNGKFVEFASFDTGELKLCGHHTENDSTGSGNNEALAKSFHAVRAAIATFRETD